MGLSPFCGGSMTSGNIALRALAFPGVALIFFGCTGVDQNRQKSAAAVAVESSFNVLKSVFNQEPSSKQSPTQSSAQNGGQVAGAAQSPAVSDPESAALARGPFGGITIIEPDPSATGLMRNSIVIYVSPEGNYASLSSGGLPGCISWVTGPTTNPAALEFGFQDPSLTETYRRADINVCPPFTVQLESDGMVRAISGQYNRKRNVVVRVPHKVPDWTLDIFERHAIKGVRLGPVATGVKRAVPFDPSQLNGGAYIGFEVADPAPGNKKGYARPIHGMVSPREVTGWGSDILVSSWHFGTLDQSGQGAMFNKAVQEKYGSPSLISGGFAYWFYDLEGKKLQANDASPFNCLGNYQEWERNLRLGGVFSSTDQGPWGCSLVVKHTYADDNAVIGTYEVRANLGNVAAMAYFRTRVGDVNIAKDKIVKLQQFKPKL